jgi:hypothetical protein
MPNITFTITERAGRKAHGTVSWSAHNLSARAVSGSSSDAAINVGIWTARRPMLLDKPAGSPYCDPSSGGATGHCWFQGFDDQFGRTEIGMHPDGGVPDATNGCIGLQISDSRPWYDAFYAVNGYVTIEVLDSTAGDDQARAIPEAL